MTQGIPILYEGSTGYDWTSTRPTLPVIGANFGSSGPYANYVLVKTVPLNPGRFNIEIDNVSGSQIAIIRDDGTAASGAAPNNASVFALAQGGGVGQQGGAWSSYTFKGRLQIYAAASTAFVTTMED